MNINDIKTIYNNEVVVKEMMDGTGGFMFMPYVIPGYSEWLGMHVSFDELGLPIFNDCKYIFNYYDEIGVDYKDYIKEIGSILNSFDLELVDEHIIFHCKSDQPSYISRSICQFLQALTLLAYIGNFKLIEE